MVQTSLIYLLVLLIFILIFHSEKLFEFHTDASAVALSLHSPLPKYPFLVLIKLNTKKTFCSGALITLRWVLTAAHCVIGEVDDSMNVSIANISQEHYEYVQGRISKYFIIPYSYSISGNFGVSDMALIKLERSFDHQPWLKTTPVAPIKSSLSRINCKVVGHDITSVSFSSIRPVYLLEYDTLVQRGCQSNYELNYRSWICHLDDNVIGDVVANSGLLLLCGVNNYSVSLAGVAVGKLQTANSEEHNNVSLMVFTDICPYLSWMRSCIGPQVIPSLGKLGADCYLSSNKNALATSHYICYTLVILILSWTSRLNFKL